MQHQEQTQHAEGPTAPGAVIGEALLGEALLVAAGQDQAMPGETARRAVRRHALVSVALIAAVWGAFGTGSREATPSTGGEASTVAPVPAAAVVSGTPVRPGCEWVVPLLEANGMPRTMADVAWRESRCLAHARNESRKTRDDSWGVLQLNWWPGATREELRMTCGVEDPVVLLDGVRNIECAGRLWAKYGSGPWDPAWYGE